MLIVVDPEAMRRFLQWRVDKCSPLSSSGGAELS